MKRLININNEISSLKKVILHRPGNEMLNLTPNNYGNLLYRNIPDLEVMQKEHDAYANLLRKEGIDVLYLIDLVVECLNANPNIRQKFIKQFIKEANISIMGVTNLVYELLNKIKDNRKLVCKCIEGIRKDEISFNNTFYNLKNNSELLVDPLVNLCFVGDLLSNLSNGSALNKMNSSTRYRESIFLDYIFKYHPKYKNTKLYYDRYASSSLEGGDILVLSDEVLCVGLSSHTEVTGITSFAKNVLSDGHFKYVLVLNVSMENDFLKLDNIISMVDKDKFVIYSKAIQNTAFYELTLYNGDLSIVELHSSVEKVFEKYLHLDKVNLIECGNGDPIDGIREQWNCAVNLLVLRPGVVISYKQNKITNELLRKNNVEVIELSGNMILSGNGGPRSLASTLIREK